jgi:2-phospho-L-lactate guanylyltransferase
MLEALVPVKGIDSGKGRLAGILPREARERLIRTMLQDVLATLMATPGITRTRILSDDQRLVPDGYASLADRGEGLNRALQRAAAELARLGVTHLLIVPADVPLATPAEIGRLVAALQEGALAIVSDAAGMGTNALALTPPTRIAPCFGAGSRAAHAAAANIAGVALRCLAAPGLERDIDAPCDLEYLIAREPARYAFLRASMRRAG